MIQSGVGIDNNVLPFERKRCLIAGRPSSGFPSLAGGAPGLRLAQLSHAQFNPLRPGGVN
jgi:hypothetical protein